jgi:hypothetical protein
MNMQYPESLLLMPHTEPPRELPIALAQQIARTRLSGALPGHAESPLCGPVMG